MMLLFVFPNRGATQTIALEPVLNYEYGYPLAIERAPGIINTFPTSGTGSSYQHTIGIGVALTMPDLFSVQLGLSPQLQYRLGFGTFTSESFPGNGYDTSVTLIKTSNHFTVISTIHSLDLSLPFEFRSGSFGAAFGSWASVELSRSIVGTVYVDSPIVPAFPAGGTSREFARGDSISVGHTHYGLEAGVFTDIPLSQSLQMEPRLYGRVDLASTSTIGTKALSAGLSLSLVPVIQPHRAVPPPADTVLSRPHAIATRLEANVHFTKNGVRHEANTPIEVAGVESYYRQYVQIPSYLVFPPTAATLPPLYEQIQATEAASFSPASLTRAALGAFAKNLLNIVGYRMSTDTGIVLTLECSSTHAADPLASERINAVKTYLRSTWGVPSRRVRSVIDPHGRSSASADTIRIITTSLVAPVATQWIERSYVIPHMGIDKAIIAEHGLRSWDIEVRQAQHILAHFSDRENADGADIANFDLAPDTVRAAHSTEPEPLVASIRATDLDAEVATDADTLRLPSYAEQDKNMTQQEVLTFVFLPQSGPASDALTDAMFAKLLSLIGPDAQISVRYPLPTSGATPADALAITERLVAELKRRTDLHPDLHLKPRSSDDVDAPPYDRSVRIRIRQSR
ncbi:MAG: hypothetical protein JSS75_11095 [Bacteroidetes bacterium]|nr:hypothetical protein [Bacteroidota bacterium]